MSDKDLDSFLYEFGVGGTRKHVWTREQAKAAINQLLQEARRDEIEKMVLKSSKFVGFGWNPDSWHKELGIYWEDRLKELSAPTKEAE